MKKEYHKPEIFFDSFELSQSIAAGCVYTSNFNRGQCGVFLPDLGLTLFANNTGSACTMKNNHNNRFCWDVPTDDLRVFSS